MKLLLSALVILIFFKSCLCYNERPIIGIATEETNGTEHENYGSSYITASYVKFLESAAARVIPVKIYETKDYYRKLMRNINGVFFPGGEDIWKSPGFGQTGRMIFDLAVELNDKNDYFPLWGTCLGFELLNYLVSNKEWMKLCDANDLASPITFASGFQNSRMFQKIPKDLWMAMETEKVTVNYHHWCMTPENFSAAGLDKFYKVLSYSKDSRNLTYISSMEAHRYPFYGVVFHPEKVLFEWMFTRSYRNIPHTSQAVKVSQYFANFFVNEARKSTHKFPNKKMEDELSIYNYNPVFTGVKNFSTEQNYYFHFT